MGPKRKRVRNSEMDLTVSEQVAMTGFNENGSMSVGNFLTEFLSTFRGRPSTSDYVS
jgi:hypothetical protein